MSGPHVEPRGQDHPDQAGLIAPLLMSFGVGIGIGVAIAIGSRNHQPQASEIEANFTLISIATPIPIPIPIPMAMGQTARIRSFDRLYDEVVARPWARASRKTPKPKATNTTRPSQLPPHPSLLKE